MKKKYALGDVVFASRDFKVRHAGKTPYEIKKDHRGYVKKIFANGTYGVRFMGRSEISMVTPEHIASFEDL